MITSNDALRQLLASVGTPVALDRVTLSGDDSSIPSRHRLPTAMGIAMAAQAALVAEIWRLRSGRTQDVRVDLADAGYALNPAAYLRQHGYPVTTKFVFQEPGNGFFPAKGGRWIYMAHGSPRLRNGLTALLQSANTKEDLSRAVASWDARELEAEAQARGLPLVMVRSTEEWRAHPHGAQLIARPAIEIERISDSAPVPFANAARPLAGVRVLESTHVLAGPGVGRCLAEQGADALRIAPPRTSDPVNFQIDTGFGKRSAFLDFDAPADVQRFQALAQDADVLVQSMRPGMMQRRGLDAASLAKQHRGLVYVSISCYGEGPWAPYTGYDPLAQAATGVATLEGGTDAPRVVPGGLLADYLTGTFGAVGALAGLLRRAQEGGSWHVKVSLAKSCMWTQDLGLLPSASRDASAQLAPPRILTMHESPFGRLDYLGPVAQFGETCAYWDKPPVPLGASPAEWLPA